MPQSIAIDNQLGRTSVAYCAIFSFISSSDICRSGIVEEIVAGSETKYTILPQKPPCKSVDTSQGFGGSKAYVRNTGCDVALHPGWDTSPSLHTIHAQILLLNPTMFSIQRQF